MILPSDETELSTKDSPANFERKLSFKGKSLNTRESFTGKIGVTINDLDNYKKDSLINIWKDANAYYSAGEDWTDADAEFFDELAVRINTATEEGIGTVSGPAVGMVANNKDKEEVMVTTHESEKGEFDYKNMEDEKTIKDEGLNGDDGLGFGQHNESFVEDDHPRDEGGQFTSGSGGSSDSGSSDSGSSDSGSSDNEEWGGNPDTNPFKDNNIKDIIKSIKGGSKNWQDWKFAEHIPEMAEIEKRNKELPKPEKPEGYTNEKIFRDDPEAVSKMELKIKYLENVADYWKQVTKFPVRDFGNNLGYSSLGDQKWYAMSNNSQLLNGTRKKLEQIKNQGTLTRNTTYKSNQYGKSKPRFYYTEEPKGESLEQIKLNETYIQDQFGVFYRPVYVGENYKEHGTDLVFEGKLYTTEGVGNCPFCKGAGKVTVEKLGLKDCPDCDGTGDIQGEQEMPPQEMPPQMEVPVEEEEKPNPFAKEADVSYSKCPNCKFETAWKEGDDWQKQDAEREMKSHKKSKHVVVEYNDQFNPNRDLSDPSWQSSGSYHDEQSNRMNSYQSNRTSYDSNDYNNSKVDDVWSDWISVIDTNLTVSELRDDWGSKAIGSNIDKLVYDKKWNDSAMSSESKANEEGTSDGAKKGWDTRGRGGSSDEDKVDNLERHHSDFMQRKGFVSGKQIEGVWEEYKSEMMPLIQQQGEITGNLAYMLEDENNHNLVRLLKDEFGVRPSSESKANEDTTFGDSDDLKNKVVIRVRTTGIFSNERGRWGSRYSGLDQSNMDEVINSVANRYNATSIRSVGGSGDGKYSSGVTAITIPREYEYQFISDINSSQNQGDDSSMKASVEEYITESCGCKTKSFEASMGKYEKFVRTEINILKKRANEGESIGLMYGLPTVRRNGKKIKGTLAYAGVSLNDRIYLPEELAKGHGKTLPLLLNHSSVAGAEEELDRLDSEMRDHLENEKDYEVGEVTLTWDADKLTLFYEGVIENEFFQKEVYDMDMAVSLGIFYDSNSPKVCDEECYTLIKGAEFREVSLVYHAGFPIATIEAVESKLKRASIKDIKAKANEDSLVKIEDNEDADTQVTVLDEWKSKEAIAEEEEDELPVGGSIAAEPKETDIVEQPAVIDLKSDEVRSSSDFSVRGVSGMTISNSNGVEKYSFDPTHNYSTNTVHFSVTEQGGTIYGEEIQLQPKMTTPKELTKEIESKPNVVFTDADEDILKKN